MRDRNLEAPVNDRHHRSHCIGFGRLHGLQSSLHHDVLAALGRVQCLANVRLADHQQPFRSTRQSRLTGCAIRRIDGQCHQRVLAQPTSDLLEQPFPDRSFDRFQLFADRVSLRHPVLANRLAPRSLSGRHQRQIDRPTGGKKGLQPVVVGLGQGVELVVVTPSTPERDAQERRSDHVDDLGQTLLAVLGQVLCPGVHSQRTKPMQTQGRQRPWVVGEQFVGSDLFADETSEWPVVIQRFDHPVAVPPGMRPRVVVFETVTVGVADDIEPVLSPFLAVGG